MILLNVFILGVLTHSLLASIPTSPLQKPEGTGRPEQASPHDRISLDDIRLHGNSVTITIDNPILAGFVNTNSMDPVLDYEANAIEIRPGSPEDIHVGDIVSYETKQGTIIHRVIKIGHDDEGWFAVFQGDNNDRPDPEKVRFDQIQRLVVAVIY